MALHVDVGLLRTRKKNQTGFPHSLDAVGSPKTENPHIVSVVVMRWLLVVGCWLLCFLVA